MSDDISRILERIKKCLALSQSPEPHEAAAALRQAQALMTKYNVDAASLTTVDVDTKDVNACVWKQPPRWEVSLAQLISRAFGLKLIFYSRSTNDPKDRARYRMVGLKSQLTIAEYAFHVVQRAVVKEREKFVATMPIYYTRGQKLNEGNQFAEAFVGAVGATVDSFALGEAHAKAIEDRHRALLGHSSKTLQARAARGSYDALLAGREAGKRVSLHRPVGNGATIKLGASSKP